MVDQLDHVTWRHTKPLWHHGSLHNFRQLHLRYTWHSTKTWWGATYFNVSKNRRTAFPQLASALATHYECPALYAWRPSYRKVASRVWYHHLSFARNLIWQNDWRNDRPTTITLDMHARGLINCRKHCLLPERQVVWDLDSHTFRNKMFTLFSSLYKSLELYARKLNISFVPRPSYALYQTLHSFSICRV